MKPSKYDSVISEVLKTCSFINEGDKEYNEMMKFISNTLHQIYFTGFRHSYSNISSTINSIFEKSKNTNEVGYQILKNLESIENKINNLSKSKYIKLYDHVSLEIKRINSETALNNLKNQIEQEIKKNESVKNEISKVHNETENLNNQLVSILGIFTGIIIAFFGGISIISGALSNMHLVNRFKLVFVIALTGLIVVDAIVLLMLSIGKIINKDIQSTICPNNQDCSTCDSCKNKNGEKSKLKVFVKKYPFIIFINIVFTIIMVSDVILWYFNISHK